MHVHILSKIRTQLTVVPFVMAAYINDLLVGIPPRVTAGVLMCDALLLL